MPSTVPNVLTTDNNGLLAPGMEILAKPFAMSTLANKVREMIEK